MGVLIEELKVSLSIPPARLFKAFILDIENLVPKVIPVFKSFKIIEGDGGAGTIKLVTYVHGDQVKTEKSRIDEVDETNYVFEYTVLEGDIVGEDIEYFTNTIKIEPCPNEGSIYKYTSQFHTKGDNYHSKQEKIKQRKEMSKTIIHTVEAYLLAHPQEYN